MKFIFIIIILLLIPLSFADPIKSIKETFSLEDSSCTSYKATITYKREVVGMVVDGENATEIILTIINSQEVPLNGVKLNEILPENLSEFIIGNQSLVWEFDEIGPKEKKVVKYGVKKKISEEYLLEFPKPTISIEEPTPIKRINGLRITAAVVAILILAFLSLLHLHIIKKTI